MRDLMRRLGYAVAGGACVLALTGCARFVSERAELEHHEVVVAADRALVADVPIE